MLIAQISDLHVKTEGHLAYGVVDTAAMLERCVSDLMALDPLPDLVLATGDLVEGGRADEYALLKSLLSPLSMPLYLLAGNHDDRQAMREVFDGPGFEYLCQEREFLHYAVDLGELRLVALDTTVPGEGYGTLCDARLDWVDARLEEDRRPTIIAMHHPPFLTGIAHMDRLGLDGGGDQFEAIVARHRHVERIVCGHLHRPIECRFGRTFASTCPSPAHQIALDLREDGPEGFVMEPPGYQLHLWHAQRLVTHTRVIGAFAGPYPFAEDSGRG